jgi:flagellar hook assembly protein FlgD
MRLVLMVSTLLVGFWTLLVPCQSAAAQASSSRAAAPTITVPAAGDTLRSIWITVEGVIPAQLLGDLRDVAILVNGAKKGQRSLQGVGFAVEDVRLDCSGTSTWNAIKAVCSGPSRKVESPEIRVLLAPGSLEIDPYLSTDAISPSRPESPSSANKEVKFRFAFSTPADWSFRLTDSGAKKPILTISGEADPECQFSWNGTDESGAHVEDGEYMYEITATSTCGDAGQANCYGVIAVDSSVPGQPTLMEPVNDDIVSPDFQLRWEPVENAWFYEVQLSNATGFDPHEVFSTGACRLRLAKRPDGVFYWRVRAMSRGGTPGPYSPARRAEVRKVMEPAISHLGVITTADGLQPEQGEVMRVTYMANDDITITIRIVTAEGTLVRTLLDGVARDKGAHVELWDGKSQDGERVPAGAYVAEISADGTEDVTPFDENRLVTVVY